MKKFLRKIDIFPGKKTYFILLTAITVNVLFLMGHIDDTGMEVINTFLGFLGMGTIALKLDRMSITIK